MAFLKAHQRTRRAKTGDASVLGSVSQVIDGGGERGTQRAWTGRRARGREADG